jgi:DNA primase
VPLVPSKDTRTSLEQAMWMFRENGHLAENYLQSRGITKETARYFHLGFVTEDAPAPWDEYAGRLAIPYLVGRSVVGFKFRATDPGEQLRYISNHGFYTKRFFHPQPLVALHRKIYICEGEIDTMTLSQLGIPAIGIGGANAWDPAMGRALRGRKVVVLVDGKGRSEAGKNAGLNFAKSILTSVDDGARIVLEDSDVNQFFLDHGAEALMEEIGWEWSE